MSTNAVDVGGVGTGAGGGGLDSGAGGAADVQAPTLTPEHQSSFDNMMKDPNFKAWYDHQQSGKQQPKKAPAQGIHPEIQGVLDRTLVAPREVDVPNGQLTGEQLRAIQQAQTQRQQLINFQNDIRGVFSKPFDYGGVTIDMSDPQRAQGFLSFVRDFVNRAPTAQELLIVHLISDLMSGAKESAGRQAETALQRGATRQAPNTADRVIVPNNKDQQPTSRSPNKVPTMLEMVAAEEGISPVAFMDRWNNNK
jgi:hypothetical protein